MSALPSPWEPQVCHEDLVNDAVHGIRERSLIGCFRYQTNVLRMQLRIRPAQRREDRRELTGPWLRPDVPVRRVKPALYSSSGINVGTKTWNITLFTS